MRKTYKKLFQSFIFRTNVSDQSINLRKPNISLKNNYTKMFTLFPKRNVAFWGTIEFKNNPVNMTVATQIGTLKPGNARNVEIPI